jgi:hypothetical protein
MNKNKKVYKLNDHVDRLIHNEPVKCEGTTKEESELLDLAKMLAADDPTGLSRVEEPLKASLLQKIKSKRLDEKGKGNLILGNQTILKRNWLPFAAGLIAVIVIALIFSVPTVQAATETFLIRIGNLILDDGPTDAEQYVATMTSGTPTATVDPAMICNDCQQAEVAGLLTITQASEQAGFPVFEAVYIPDGYQLETRSVLFTGQTVTVDTSYRMELHPPLHNGAQMSAIIAIEQTYFVEGSVPWESNVGEVPILEVTVRGLPGVWLEQIPIYPYQNDDGTWDYAKWNQLIWAEDGYNLMIQTNMPSDLLPIIELQKIADSLH